MLASPDAFVIARGRHGEVKIANYADILEFVFGEGSANANKLDAWDPRGQYWRQRSTSDGIVVALDYDRLLIRHYDNDLLRGFGHHVAALEEQETVRRARAPGAKVCTAGLMSYGSAVLRMYDGRRVALAPRRRARMTSRWIGSRPLTMHGTGAGEDLRRYVLILDVHIRTYSSWRGAAGTGGR